ncbi:phage shock protein PspC (stress-responsive transcriptional regulator) [Silvibacterium bohemicum]|uniref:Phage shock protein PspC (Stress-responsive transcriptional regulator) n=1 Tax=Silvibacterium bohemicum TaxID=1577686 RepID=A0A841JX92_9BACT|nr:hypothetical protein [Silvibacterium bohemicum]MBB6145057.1 phage shock protein PspC (stress-responsive transcriptional regulator) [Silvibacterium bohemicum]
MAALLSILFLYAAMFGSLRALITSQQGVEYGLPPLWFLGIYQQILEGHATSPAFVRLAHIGWCATLSTTFLAVLFYPIAYVRKIRGLMEGIAARQEQRRKLIRIGLHATVVRSAPARAIWHFIGQTLLGVARYRFYLVMYGGIGLALLVSAVLRIDVEHERLAVAFSHDGLRAALPIVAFWTVSGFRMTFMSPADQKATWVFRVIAGKAKHEHLATARRWVVCWAAGLSLAVLGIAAIVMPNSYPNWRAFIGQVVVAFGLCILLTDAFFFDIKTIPFTYKSSSSTTNFTLHLIPYLAFFPAIVFATVALEPWIESQNSHLIVTALMILTIHLGVHSFNKAAIAEHIARADLDGDEEDFPLRLGLR